MRKLESRFIAVLALSLLLPVSSRADTFGLDTLDLQYAEQGWGEPHANKSVDDHPIFIVLDVSQDPLGRQAGRIGKRGSLEIWAKDLEDGSKAVGLFNLGEDGQPVRVSWADLGLTGKHQVRDSWRQADLGRFTDHFEATVPRHGVVLVKISK
jgi:hypothetical protein